MVNLNFTVCFFNVAGCNNYLRFVLEIKIKMSLIINPYTHYFATPINHNKQTTYIVLDGGHGGKPTERTTEGFPRVASLWFVSLASKEMNEIKPINIIKLKATHTFVASV
jgi:hypothetical protein